MQKFFFYLKYNLTYCVRAIKRFGVSPSGKASAFGADIRWFESSHPSHRIQTVRNGGFFFIYQAFILVRMFKSQNRLFLSNIRTFLIFNLCISIAYGILINFVSHLIYIIPPQGTDLHAATVVGDPYKNTSSAALNPIIKFATLFGLLAAEMAVASPRCVSLELDVAFFIIRLIFVLKSFYCMKIESTKN